MSVKKPAKTLLEYDPLSWLKEDNVDQPVASKKKSSSKKAATAKKSASAKKQVVSRKKAAAKKVSSSTVEKEAVKTAKSKVTAPEPAVTSGELLSLGSELTIKNVADFKQQIEASLTGDNDIRLDPGDLQKIDTSGLQLLYSLQKTLAKSSQQINWVSRNSVLDSAAELIGMDELIQATTASSDQEQGFGFF